MFQELSFPYSQNIAKSTCVLNTKRLSAHDIFCSSGIQVGKMVIIGDLQARA